jgi:hypothetical protein
MRNGSAVGSLDRATEASVLVLSVLSEEHLSRIKVASIYMMSGWSRRFERLEPFKCYRLRAVPGGAGEAKTYWESFANYSL